VRTTVFLKGCPLRCAWCHNPESQRPEPELAWESGVGPGKGESKVIGRKVDSAEILRLIERDADYYRESGGGLTLSGGEPLMQSSFAAAIAAEAKAAGIHVCLDTSGQASPEDLAAVARFVDLFLWDVKTLPGKKHAELTGSDGRLIHENLGALARSGAAIMLRCPLVPGINDSPAELEHIAELSEAWSSILGAQILPYHRLGIGKRRKTEAGFAQRAFDLPNPERIEAWKSWFDGHGAKKVTIVA
jgi:pyruvate formate lyase activating enzyme